MSLGPVSQNLGLRVGETLLTTGANMSLLIGYLLASRISGHCLLSVGSNLVVNKFRPGQFTSF